MRRERLTGRGALGACLAALLLVASCAGSSADTSSAQGSQSPSGKIVVFAAASLTEAFTELKAGFEAKYPDTQVVTQFAGSTTLATQLLRGAPAGVYASANTAQMRRVVDAGVTTSEPTVFAKNTLQIVVPKGNPANVRGLRAFGREGLTIALCAPKVPCGALSREVLKLAGIEPAADTLEQDVKAVLTKVRLGEVDAGLVYRTDVASAQGPVQGIAFPAADKAANEYPIAALQSASNAAGARAFVQYVLSAAGQRVLAEYGFSTVES